MGRPVARDYGWLHGNQRERWPKPPRPSHADLVLPSRSALLALTPFTSNELRRFGGKRRAARFAATWPRKEKTHG